MSFLLRIKRELFKNLTIYICTAILAIIGGMSLYIGKQWISTLQTKLENQTCSLIETNLNERIKQAAHGILIREIDNLGATDPLIYYLSKLANDAQKVKSCPRAVKLGRIANILSRGLRAYAEKDYERANKEFIRMPSEELPVVYYRMLSATKYHLSRQAKNKADKNNLLDSFYNLADAAYKQAQSSYFGPDRKEIVTKLKCDSMSPNKKTNKWLSCLDKLRASTLHPDLYYNIACAYSIKGDYKQALLNFSYFVRGDLSIGQSDVLHDSECFSGILEDPIYSTKFRALVSKLSF